MKYRREWPKLTWLWIIIAGLFIVIGVYTGEALGDTYETYFRYSDTTADSVVWNVFTDGDTLVNGKASKWKGENSGLWIDTITIGSQNGLWIDFLIWTGTDYDPSGYYLNQRANIIAIAGDSIAANDIDARIDTLVDTALAQDNWVSHQTTVDSIYAIDDSIYDTLLIVQDTLEEYDDWIATEVTAAKALDSLADILDTLESHDDWVAQEAGEIADILDTLQNQDDWIATAAELAKVIDSLADILDSLETQSTWIQDSLYALLDTVQLYDGRYALASELVKAIDSINGILDTLQLQDGWVATEATATKILDSLADVLDSLETQSTWIQDSLYALLDTLQLWDTRIDSIETALADANIGDKVWADGSPTTRGEINDILDTLQLYDTRFDSLLAALADANIGDKVWTDPGTRTITGGTLTTPADYKADVSALALQAEVENIDGWNPITDNDSLIVDQSTLSERPAIGDTIGRNASIFDPTSDSVLVDVSAANTAAGLVDKIAASSADSIWDEILTGTTHNIETSAGRKLRELAGAYVLSAGDAQGGGNNYIILAATEDYADDWYNSTVISLVGGTGEGQIRHIHDYTGATDSVYISIGDEWITNPDVTSEYVIIGEVKGYVDYMHDNAVAAIVDATWDEDTTGHGTAQSFAVMLKDTLAYQSSGAVTDAQMGAIADSVFNRDTADHNVAQSYGVLFKDTSAYQGAAAGITAAEVSDSVWDKLQSEHTTQGTFGAYLDDTVSGISLSPDSGGNVLTLIALDTSGDTSNVPFLKHSCQSVDGSVDYSFKYTESDGIKTWALDNDSFIFTTSGYNYIQETVPDTVVVFGNTTDTLRLYPFDPGGPTGAAAASKCRVWSRIFSKDDGTGREGIKVTVTTPYKLRYGNIPIYQFAEITTTDSTGYWYFDLIKSDSLTPSAKAIYQFIAKDTLEIIPVFDVKAKVPDTSSWQLRYWRD